MNDRSEVGPHRQQLWNAMVVLASLRAMPVVVGIRAPAAAVVAVVGVVAIAVAVEEADAVVAPSLSSSSNDASS
jgi:hypothetical protein